MSDNHDTNHDDHIAKLLYVLSMIFITIAVGAGIWILVNLLFR